MLGYSATLIITLTVYMIDRIYKLTPNSTPRKSQMTKVIHSDFLTVAEAMTSAFSSIEKNKSWDLMPSLVPELALCLHMLKRG